MAALAFGPIVSTTMAIRATGNSAAGVARRWVPSGTADAGSGTRPPSGRDTVLWWVADERTAGPWVVADIGTPQTTFQSAREQMRHVALLERSGYQAVFQRDGYIALRRAGSGRSVSRKEAQG